MHSLLCKMCECLINKLHTKLGVYKRKLVINILKKLVYVSYMKKFLSFLYNSFVSNYMIFKVLI